MSNFTEDRAAFEAATPGEWCVHPNGSSIWDGVEYDSTGTSKQRMVVGSQVSIEGSDNCELIVRMHSTYLARMALIEVLEAERETALDGLMRQRSRIKELESANLLLRENLEVRDVELSEAVQRVRQARAALVCAKRA